MGRTILILILGFTKSMPYRKNWRSRALSTQSKIGARGSRALSTLGIMGIDWNASFDPKLKLLCLAI